MGAKGKEGGKESLEESDQETEEAVIQIPRIYPIIDVSCFASREQIFPFADALVRAGCTWIQYRNKAGSSRDMLSDARELRRRVSLGVMLVMNDRADLALAAGFDGVHVGQDDLPVESVRRVVGAQFIVGTSTHNPEQLALADRTSADYLAIGPVYATASKAHPDPVVGVEGVRRAKDLTRKPLVAIGGISADRAQAVIKAGADSLALISSLMPDPMKSLAQFRGLMM
jgi:thiamine-phosphate pyrophosphorylase